MLTLLLQVATMQLLTILWLSSYWLPSRLAWTSFIIWRMCAVNGDNVQYTRCGATGVSALFQTSPAMLLDLAGYI